MWKVYEKWTSSDYNTSQWACELKSLISIVYLFKSEIQLKSAHFSSSSLVLIGAFPVKSAHFSCWLSAELVWVELHGEVSIATGIASIGASSELAAHAVKKVLNEVQFDMIHDNQI